MNIIKSLGILAQKSDRVATEYLQMSKCSVY